VASFCIEERIVENYRKKCEGPVKQGLRQGVISGAGYGFSFAMLFCFYAISFYVGALFIHNGTADVGQVFKVKNSKILLDHICFCCLLFILFIISTVS